MSLEDDLSHILGDDQLGKALNIMSGMAASLYKDFVKEGIPPEHAVMLTASMVSQFFSLAQKQQGNAQANG